MKKYLVAVGQINSRSDVQANYETVERMIAEAADKGAKLVIFPENMTCVGKPHKEIAEQVPGGESCRRMAAAAKKHNIWVHMGSIKELIPGDDRVYNTSALFSPEGEMMGLYRKLHPCDMESAPGRVSRESATVRPGDEIVVTETELGTLGMSICYDVRFPEFYRAMALKGAQILCIPACFGTITGEAHWELMCRARAVENGCYVLAAGQCGTKDNGSLRNGNSMIIDPWGKVLARAGQDAEELLVAEVDLDYAADVRARLGVLKNRRTDVYDQIIKK